MLSFWPQDVNEISNCHVQQFGQLGGQVIIWAGWKCQNPSPAGSGRGLGGGGATQLYFLQFAASSSVDAAAVVATTCLGD
jgi:hypothetical protein